MVPFDGFIVDTLDSRAAALAHAFSEVLGESMIAHCRDALPGRTFNEAAHALGSAVGAVTVDETLLDIVALAAAREFSRSLLHGVTLLPHAMQWLAGCQSRSVRVVARADSARHDVNAVLALGMLGEAFAFVRCSDDVPRVAAIASLEASWQAIDRRLTTAGIRSDRRSAMEFTPDAQRIAARWVAAVQAPTLQ